MQPVTPAAPLAVPEPLRVLVRARALDAELAALFWLLLDARTPMLVAGAEHAGREAVVDALDAALPAGAVRIPVPAGDDDFSWLPEAAVLGWRDAAGNRPSVSGGVTAVPPAGEGAPVADPRTGVLLVRDLADGAAGGPDGDRARILVRALALGYGMLGTMPGDSLDAVLGRLGVPSIGTDEDERSRLGVVVVLAPPAAGRGPRVAVAHLVRPVALDTHGHVQRLPPAVLATWNPGTDRWDHFAWGALADLAGRTGRVPRDFEREQARRAAALTG